MTGQVYVATCPQAVTRTVSGASGCTTMAWEGHANSLAARALAISPAEGVAQPASRTTGAARTRKGRRMEGPAACTAPPRTHVFCRARDDSPGTFDRGSNQHGALRQSLTFEVKTSNGAREGVRLRIPRVFALAAADA